MDNEKSFWFYAGIILVGGGVFTVGTILICNTLNIHPNQITIAAGGVIIAVVLASNS